MKIALVTRPVPPLSCLEPRSTARAASCKSSAPSGFSGAQFAASPELFRFSGDTTRRDA